MGWKAACILASQRPAPWLTNIPRHDPEFARRISTTLPVGNVQSASMTTFEEGIYPQQLVIGAYPDSLIIGHYGLCKSCLIDEAPPVIPAIQTLLPGATTLVLALHSVVNFYGYALFEGTQRVRIRYGSADDGVLLDEGDWLPEERPLYARSELRDGKRVFFHEINGQMEEFDHSSYGEEFVFALSARCFGQPLDQMEDWGYPMEVFEPVRKPFWKWIFGG